MKALTVLLWFTAIFLTTGNATAADIQVDLTTPRGSLVKLDIYNPGLGSLLLLAPGQGCGARYDMYNAIAAEAKESGFTLVRLFWAYCVADPEHGNPSQDLSLEGEDLISALKYARENLGFSDAKIYIGGKSLGSFVSAEVFKKEKLLQGLVLLTPVCTDAETNAGQHRNTFLENYPELNLETRPVLLAQGNADPICDANHFQDYVKSQGTNFVPLVVRGDHGFGVKNPEGQYIAELGAKNLRVIAKWIFSWLK